MPPLLETYEEARLLLGAKGLGVGEAAEHLSELPGVRWLQPRNPASPGRRVPEQMGLIRFGGRLSKQVEGVHGIGAEEAEAGEAELHR